MIIRKLLKGRLTPTIIDFQGLASDSTILHLMRMPYFIAKRVFHQEINSQQFKGYQVLIALFLNKKAEPLLTLP